MERNRIEKEYKSKLIFRGVASAAVLQALISLKPPLFTPPAFSQAVRVCTWSIHHSWSGCDQGGTSHILFPLMIMKFFTFAICKSFIFVTWFQESMSIMFLFFSFFLPFFFFESFIASWVKSYFIHKYIGIMGLREGGGWLEISLLWADRSFEVGGEFLGYPNLLNLYKKNLIKFF